MNMIKIAIWLFLFSVSFIHADQKGQTDKEYELAVCAIFQNEAPFLKEWIEFHRLVGVEHFLLYNHLSEDNFEEVLNPYIKKGLVEVIDWPYPIQDKKTWARVQTNAYNHALSTNGDRIKWIAFIDTDEFLFPVKEDNLVDFLKDFEAFGGVGVNWQMFGTSNVKFIPKNRLLIEMLLYKADTEFSANLHVKSIVQPLRVRRFKNAHIATYKEGYFQVNANGESFTGPFSPYVDIGKIRINHYWTRDESYFYDQKIASRKKRGRNVEADLNMASFMNEVIDKEILRFVPDLRKKMTPTSQ